MAAAQNIGAEPTRTTLYVADLDWWINCADSERNFHGQTYERGSITSNPLNTPPWTERHFEVGRSGHGAFTKDRRIRVGWLRFSPTERVLLQAHYMHARWPLGAHHVSLCTRPIGDNESLYMPGAALYLSQVADEDGAEIRKLLDALQRKPSAPVITKALDRARAAVEAAHATWFGQAEAEAQAWMEA